MRPPSRRVLLDFISPTCLAIVVLGPALRPGAIFNLDFVLVPQPHVPDSFWGIGPELPRTAPILILLNAISGLVSFTTTVKILLIGLFVLAWNNMKRLAESLGVMRPRVAALLYVTIPFLTTRIAVGHLGIVATFAVLPWAVPKLLDAVSDRRSSFIAALALATTGYFGGVVCLMIVTAGLFTSNQTNRGFVRTFASTCSAQLMWIVPGVLVSLTHPRQLPDSSWFSTDISGSSLGLLSLSNGGGFWNAEYQQGPSSIVAGLVGALLLLLAVIGHQMMPVRLRRPLVIGNAIGWLIAVSPTLGLSRQLHNALTATSWGAILREPQRLLVLHLLWLIPAACLGLERLQSLRTSPILEFASRKLLLLAPLGASLINILPSVWGMNQMLDAEPIPACWTNTKSLVEQSGGTVLSLPWRMYFNQQIGDSPLKRVIDPMPLFLDTDVIHSSDNGLGGSISEIGDVREQRMKEIIQGHLRAGQAISPDIARQGVRWVIVQESVVIDDFSKLRDDPGLELVFTCPELSLYKVIDPNIRPYELLVEQQLAPGIIRLENRSEEILKTSVESNSLWVSDSEGITTVDDLFAIRKGSFLVWNLGSIIVGATYIWTLFTFARHLWLMLSTKMSRPSLIAERRRRLANHPEESNQANSRQP